SRRRHTRLQGDWSSDVCSSDLKPALQGLAANLEKAYPVVQKDQTFMTAPVSRNSVSNNPGAESGIEVIAPLLLGMAVVVLLVARSEERRVGKECRCRGWEWDVE